MLKIFGSLAVITATTLIGIVAGKELEYRLFSLRYIKKLMLMLRGEINYLKAPLYEAFVNVGRRSKEPYKEFFLKVSDGIENLSCDSFYEIWSSSTELLKNNTSLTDKDLRLLKRVGECLGYMDKDMQLGMIDLYIEQLDLEIKIAQEEIKDKVKVYNCLGIMAGIFAVIMMV